MSQLSALPSCLQDDDFPILTALALHNAPIGMNKLLDLLRACGVKMAASRQIDGAYLKKKLTDLSLNLVVENLDRNPGYKIRSDVHQDLRAQLLLRTQQDRQLSFWIELLRAHYQKQNEYSSWQSPSAFFCAREVFFSLLIGNVKEVDLWRDRLLNAYDYRGERPENFFFENAYAVRLFETIAVGLQANILVYVLFPANWVLLECNLAYQFAKDHFDQLSTSSSELLEELAWQGLLRGDFAMLQKIADKTQGKRAACTPLLILAMLKADYVLGGDILDAQIKVIKADTGKRKVFLPHLTGLMASVCWMGKQDVASLKQVKEQVDEACKQQHARAYFALQPFTDHLAKGVPLLHRGAVQMPMETVDTLFEALAWYWQDLPKHEFMRERLIKVRKLATQRGYHWVAAELDLVNHLYFTDPLVFPDWHAEHKVVPLVKAVQREESWQRALKALSQLKPNVEVSSSSSDTRIAWLLFYSAHHVGLEPREQKRGVKGAWSKGRPVALKRLANEQDSLTGMSEQDKRIASCISKSYDGYYGGSEYDLNAEKALPHLIGHPYVYWFDAQDVRIDVVKGEIALQLKEYGEKISLQLDPAISAANSVIWRKQTPTKLAVYSTNPEIKQIASILGEGLTVPAVAKAQLVGVIAAIAPHMAINSDLPELAQHITSVPADARLYAHLLPLNEGLRVQILVRPLASGSWLTPGKGSANVLGEQDGMAVQVSRQLKQEAAALKKLEQVCSTLAQAEHDGQEWQLSHPEHCLELLTQLKLLPENELELVWPEGERFRLKGSRSLNQMRLSIKKQGEWFVASGEISLDDGRIIALRELMHLAAGTSGRFIKLGDNDYLALTENFRKRLEELQSFGENLGKDGLRINRLAAPALAELADEVGELKADSAWREQVKKLDALADFVPELPSTLQAELRDYQLVGYQWLARLAQWGVGACLADDMGLGKTVQALALLLDRAPQGPALVVAPISVAMNWQAEVARFAPTLKVRAYHSNRSLADLGPFDIVIASYGMLQSDSEVFSAQHWHSVVLDEAQVIKNAATKRSQAAMALTADFKMIASGTPVENHLGELWNLFRFINPGLLGSKERFAERYANPIERGEKPAKLHLKKLIQPFILRRTKTQVLSELPSRTEITLQVELSSEERHLYEALRQEAVDKIANMNPAEGKSMQVLAEITKLRRFCCNPQLVLKNAKQGVSSSKLAVFAETVAELLDNKHKALVFSQFVDHLAIIRTHLDQQGISYQYLDGSTPPIERKKRVDAFQAGEGDIFLISLKAGGTGLNLTAADYVIHLDPWWNPAVEDQASDRAHRMGQLRPVTIYRLVVQDTIEEKILALHAQKRDLADSLLEGGDAAGKMDTAALLRLLKEGA
ncbi:MAG: DEAD/DEAH box helicase [Undibacterium sp.]|nr:DEAD/DEAH box helicase [Undibacterium sp.]